MSMLQKVVPLLGRILISAIFLASGFNKITNFSGTAEHMADAGMPAASLLLVGAIIFEIGGGLSVLLGLWARWGAAALIVFLIPTTLIFHDFWTFEDPAQRQGQMIHFMKNLAILGGLMFVFAHGSGPLSLVGKRTPGARQDLESPA